MKLKITWNKYTWKWQIADHNGMMFLPDAPDCVNMHRVFSDLSYEKPNFYDSVNIKTDDPTPHA